MGDSQNERYRPRTVFDGSDQSFYYNEAIDDFSKAIQLDREDKYNYYWRGRSHYELEEYEEAIDDYDKAVELDSDFAEAYHWRGNSYYLLESYERALDDAQAIIDLGPPNTLNSAYNIRGLVYNATGKTSQAGAAYSKAIELNPESGAVYFNRAQVYKRSGQYALQQAD